MAKKKETAVEVSVPEIRLQQFEIVIVGDSPLICHNWSKKVRQEMLDKQMKKAKQAREAKNPEEDYRESLYHLPDGSGYGFPTVAFKAAAVGACRFVQGIAMTEARGAFHVHGDMARIEGEPRMREDMVRVGMGAADIRYRGEFTQWRTKLTITYNESALSMEQIINLFNVGGFGVGVGEWRPERDGSFGRFHVE